MNFVMPVVEGFVTGIGLSLTLGTVFFALIQNSLIFGYKKGILIASGVAFSDIVLISLVLWSDSFIGFLQNCAKEVTIVGAILLIVFGIAQFAKKVANKEGIKDYSGSLFGDIFFVGKGIFLNVINPVNFFVWLSISAMLSAKFHYVIDEKLAFFIASVIAIFTVESLLAIFAARVRKLMNDKRIRWVNRISGTIFIGIGVYLLCS
ncbi:MAG: LysE family translocator [Bacteroidia bacterium]|nr:LysE family translocator [Bacteroidia bacterium]